jgi:hypothetical protein
VFHGKNETLPGQFALVLWDNHMTPIIRGRELLGLPKLFAEIPDPVQAETRWEIRASEGGARLVDMSLSDVREFDADEARELEAKPPSRGSHSGTTPPSTGSEPRSASLSS